MGVEVGCETVGLSVGVLPGGVLVVLFPTGGGGSKVDDTPGGVETVPEGVATGG